MYIFQCRARLAHNQSPETYTQRYQQAEKRTTIMNNEFLLQEERKAENPPHKARVCQPIPATIPSLPNTCFFCRSSH